jgi:uncharacterized YigZ family protein
MPFTLAAPVHSEQVIKKSRFIGCVEPVTGREQAVARVSQLRAEHPAARHVCWALMAGGHSAANDDGEPSGTAGRPMLDVLRHQELEGVLATVVRYFGGVKLGAGGLVRAYTDCVAQALLGAERVPLIRMRTLRVTVPYAVEGALRREFEAHGATLEDVRHGRDVALTVQLPEDRAASLMARVDDLSQGRAVWGDVSEGS